LYFKPRQYVMGGYFVGASGVRCGFVMTQWTVFSSVLLVADVSNTVGKEGETVGDAALSLHTFLDTRKA